MENNIDIAQLSGVFEAIKKFREHLPDDFVCLAEKCNPEDVHCMACGFEDIGINISEICALELAVEKLTMTGEEEDRSNPKGDNTRDITKKIMEQAIEDAADLVPYQARPEHGFEENRYLVAMTLFIARWEAILKETEPFPGGF